MTWVPFSPHTFFLQPFGMDGTTDSGIELIHHVKLPIIYGRVTAVHPSCRNVAVGDWVIFPPERPERLTTASGTLYCLDERIALGVVEPGDGRPYFNT